MVHAHPQGLGWRLANSPEGRRELVRQLRRMARRCRLRIGFEPSGGYERRLAILLEKKGFAAYLLDAGRVHAFGRAEGKLAKTDPLDAALIARALAALHGDLEPWRHDPLAERRAERRRHAAGAYARTRQSQQPPGCHAGRPAVRRVLYLAALSILRSRKSPLANLGKRLRENGKPAKIAIIATARKLLVTLNAMLKQDASFHTP